MAPKRSRLQLLFDLAQLTFRKEGQPTAQQLDVLKQALSELALDAWGTRWVPPPARSGTASVRRCYPDAPLTGTSRRPHNP